MPVQTRSGASRKRQIVDVDGECTICYEPVEGSRIINCEGVKRPRNAILCPNKHHTCLACVRKLVFPAPCCVGFSYRCPVCRAYCCLDKGELMILIKGDANELIEMFGCAHAMQSWVCE